MEKLKHTADGQLISDNPFTLGTKAIYTSPVNELSYPVTITEEALKLQHARRNDAYFKQQKGQYFTMDRSGTALWTAAKYLKIVE